MLCAIEREQILNRHVPRELSLTQISLLGADEPSDTQLMARVSSGDEQAFASIIGRHQRPVLSIAYRFLGDQSWAEDVAQEVFLRLWQSARRYRPEAALGAYIRRITVNFCLDLRRKERFQAPPRPHIVRRSRLAAAQASLVQIPGLTRTSGGSE